MFSPKLTSRRILSITGCLSLYVVAFAQPVIASSTIPEVIFRHKEPDVAISNEHVVNELAAKIDKNPHVVSNYIHLARTLLQMGLENMAADTLERMEANCPGSFMRAFSESIEGDQQFAQEFLIFAQQKYYAQPQVQFYTAKMLRQYNFLDKSEEILAKLAGSGTYVRGQYALSADLALQQHKWEDAYRNAEKELKRDPSNLDAQQYRLWAMNKLGLLTDAEGENLKVLYLRDPRRTDIGVLYGDYLLRRHRFSDATLALLQGLTATSDEKVFDLAVKDLSRIFSRLSDPEIDSAVKTVLSDARADALLSSLVYLKVGRVLTSSGRYALARKYLEQSLAFSTYFAAGTYHDLARVAQLQGDESAAQEYYEKAFNVNPNDAVAWKQFTQFRGTLERRRQRKQSEKRDVAARLKKGLTPDSPAHSRVDRTKYSAPVEWRWNR